MDPNQLDRMMNGQCPLTVERRDDVGRQQATQTSPQPPLLLQRKDYLPIGVVKILQEKELVSNSNQLGV